MPSNHSHRRSKRKRFRKNGLTKVKRDIDWLKKNIEFKFNDTDFSVVLVDTTGDISGFNSTIGADAAFDGRSGEEITARRVLVRGFVANNRGTPVDVMVRIIIGRKLNSQGTITSMSQVLEGTGSVAINRMRNMDFKTDIKIYADETFAMDTLAHTQIPFKFLFKLNHQVKYGTVSAAVPLTNEMFLLILGSTAASANTPAASFTVRYSYCDS